MVEPWTPGAVIHVGRFVPHIQIPSVGRTVHYVMNREDVAWVGFSRQDTYDKSEWLRDRLRTGPRGYDRLECGMVLPMIVVTVHPGQVVGGQVLLPGVDGFLWVPRAEYGEAEGRWHWPPRV